MMKPIKYIKPHNFVEKDFILTGNGLLDMALRNSRTYSREGYATTLLEKINEISAQIHQTTMRVGGGNFMVYGGDVDARVDEIMREELFPTNTEPSWTTGVTIN